MGVALIEEKMTENRLKWFGFGHVQKAGRHHEKSRLYDFSPVKRGRGGPRRALEELVKMDIMVNNIPETLVFNQTEWHYVIHHRCSQPHLVG